MTIETCTPEVSRVASTGRSSSDEFTNSIDVGQLYSDMRSLPDYQNQTANSFCHDADAIDFSSDYLPAMDLGNVNIDMSRLNGMRRTDRMTADFSLNDASLKTSLEFEPLKLEMKAGDFIETDGNYHIQGANTESEQDERNEQRTAGADGLSPFEKAQIIINDVIESFQKALMEGGCWLCPQFWQSFWSNFWDALRRDLNIVPPSPYPGPGPNPNPNPNPVPGPNPPPSPGPLPGPYPPPPAPRPEPVPAPEPEPTPRPGPQPGDNPEPEPGSYEAQVDRLFQRLDANGDKTLTSREWLDAYSKLDANEDGIISQDELSRFEPLNTAQADLLRAVDQNEDGKIDANEWTAAYGQMESTRDSDAAVAVKEFRQFLRAVPDAPPEPGDGSLQESGDRLHDALDDHFSGERLERIEEMMEEFEERGRERVEALVAAGQDRVTVEREWEEKIKKTYENLTEMVTSDSPDAPYDTETRAKMAENALYLVMDPTKSNQGQHGTCWIESEINLLGLTNNPDQMTRLLKEVTTTGTYTDLTGKTYTIPTKLLQFPGEEKSWTISNADNGLRSPVGAIFDRTLSFMGGRMDGGTNGGTPQEAAALMKRVTGGSVTIVQIRDNNLTANDIERICSSQYRQAMLEQGGVILLGPGHMFAAKLVNNNGQWQIVGDNQWGAGNDQLIGTVGDLGRWDVRTTRQRYVPEEQSILPIANDTPIGVRSYSSLDSTYGYTPTGSYSDAGIVLPQNGVTTEIYDDYNPDFKLDVPGGNGDIEIPTGTRILPQFRRKDFENRRDAMLKRWRELNSTGTVRTRE